MIPTVAYIQARFDEYNERFFGGSLPPIPVRLSHAKGFLGKVCFVRKRQGLFGGYRNTDFVLRINARIDLDETLVQDTILHEMIHYYIAYNQWHDSSTHGHLFRREMARINREGNRHITISHRLNEDERAQATIHKGRIVALVHFSDGKTGVKVLPKQIKHIMAWNKQAHRRFAIDDIEWFYTDDGYFAQYPSSVALRIYLISNPDELPLSNAHRLLLGDKQVRLQTNPANPLKW